MRYHNHFTLMRIPIFILLFISLFSCKDDQHIPNVENIKVDWNFITFHLDQIQLSQNPLHLEAVQEQYPVFSELFFNSVLPISALGDSEIAEVFSDSSFIALLDTCVFIFEDLKSLEDQFDASFRFYSHYTGENHFPNIYTFVSGFAYQNFIFNDAHSDGLGIGLDMYIGRDFSYKSINPTNPTFSAFLTRYFDPQYLVRKSLLSWLDDKVPVASTSQLLDIIIRNGKIIYILDKILPNEPDDVILEWQPEQLDWCMSNEEELWTHLLKLNLLYSSNFTQFNKFVNPSPNVPGLPAEAPGGVANYIGWRIVQDYMFRSGASMNELINEIDFQKIFQLSKYRPRNRFNAS